MTLAPTRLLATRLGAAGRTAREVRAVAVDLADVARRLGDDRAAGALTGAATRLGEDTYALMVLGRFNAGKSTLINALLADARGVRWPAAGIVPVSDEATTPTLIRIEYADDPYAQVFRPDGRRYELSLEQLRAGYVLDSREGSNTDRFGGGVSCLIGVPAELLRGPVVLYDTPGTADSDGRDELTHDALRRCDAAIAVYAMGEYGYHETGNEQLAREEQVQILTVVNTFGKPVTEDRRRSAWNRLVMPHTGDEYAGQDLAAWHVHFVDARAALERRACGADTTGTGLDAFEDDLGTFLLTGRREQHLARHLHVVRTHREQLSAAGRSRAIRAWVAVDELTRRRQALDQELRELRAARRELRPTMTTAGRQAAADVTRSFRAELAAIGAELPVRLRGAPLPSWRTGVLGRQWNAVNRHVLARELAEVAHRYATERLAAWSVRTAGLVREQADEAATGVAPLVVRAAAAPPDTPAGTDEFLSRLTPPAPPIEFLRRRPEMIALAPASVAMAVGAVAAMAGPAVTLGGLTDWFLGEPWTELRDRLGGYEEGMLAYAAATFTTAADAVRGHSDRVIAEAQGRVEADLPGVDARLESSRAELDRLNRLAGDLERAGATLAAATGGTG